MANKIMKWERKKEREEEEKKIGLEAVFAACKLHNGSSKVLIKWENLMDHKNTWENFLDTHR